MQLPKLTNYKLSFTSIYFYIFNAIKTSYASKLKIDFVLTFKKSSAYTLQSFLNLRDKTAILLILMKL